jgi:cytochrome c5
MKRIFTAALVAATATLLTVPLAAWASDDDGVTEKEVMAAEGVPPTVPHDIEKTRDKHCLECHEKGKYGAPETPHPERKYCVQCHGQGEIKVDLDKIKKQYKNKKK